MSTPLSLAYIDGIEFGLHPDQADVGLDPARRGAHAGEQPAAADRDDQRVDLGHILEHFERDRPLPRGDMRIIERMDEGQPALDFQLARMRIGIVVFLAEQDDFGAVARSAYTFTCRRRLRHHDGDRHAQPLAVIGQPLRMIARRCRDHARARAPRVHQQQRVERAAFLVGRGELQVLELQPDCRRRSSRTASAECSVGVRTIAPSIRAAAARTSSRVIAGRSAADRVGAVCS